jgi:iron complex transport system ATP-binding protein
MNLFDTQKLTFRFPGPSSFELSVPDLSINQGECLGFLGPNGAGKSTLLRLLAGLLTPRKGKVLFQHKPIQSYGAGERARKIAFVAQATQFAFPLTVWEIVEMGRHPHLGRFGRFSAQDREICEKSLDLCDALDFRDRFYDQLSGGEKQRVLLASALAQTPEVLMLDEPTLSLDLAHQLSLFEIIKKLHRSEGLTVLVATHELNLTARYLDRVVLMKNGRIEADGDPAKILTPARIHSVLNVHVEKVKGRSRQTYFLPLPSKGKKK